jgi:hypothetical protein
MAVALLALFVALAGGAYAQANLPANSVGTGQLRNRAVTHPKLAHNSVWHANIGRHSVRNNNLAANSVWHAQLGGGVVRRNNMSAPLLSDLQAQSVFGEGAAGTMPPSQVTEIRPSFHIFTTAAEHALTVQAVIQLENTGTAVGRVQCRAFLAGNQPDVLAFITVGAPPASNDTQMTLLGRWNISAGSHTVTLSCVPFRPVAGTVSINAQARILLTAADEGSRG